MRHLLQFKVVVYRFLCRRVWECAIKPQFVDIFCLEFELPPAPECSRYFKKFRYITRMFAPDVVIQLCRGRP